MEKQKLYLLFTVFITFIFGGSKIAFDANLIKNEHNYYSKFLEFIEIFVDKEVEEESWLESIVGSLINRKKVNKRSLTSLLTVIYNQKSEKIIFKVELYQLD